MQVSIETTVGLERRLMISVPAVEIDSKIDAKVAEASKSVNLKGFRKGKVPSSVIKAQFGTGIRQEIVGDAVSQSFFEAVTQEKLEPAGQPLIDFKQNKTGKDLEYTATFEVVPEVVIADLSKITIEKPVAEVTDADIERMIEMLRDQQGEWLDVERAAAEKDQVNIDYAGTKDGEAFEGGSAEGTDLVLGSGQMIPGFEDGIVGLTAGQETTLSLSFPEDYHVEDLKGAAVEFAIKVHAVKERKIADMDEAFFAKFNIEGDEATFREEIKKNMTRELAQAKNRLVKQAVMDQLNEIHEIALPQAMVASEIDALREQMFQQFGQMGGDFKPNKEMLPDELFKDRAEPRVALGLIVRGIISEHSISVDADLVKAEIESLASGYETPEEVVNYYYSNQQLLQGVESKVLEDQVVDYVLSQATVSDVEKNYQDIVQAAAQAANQ